MKELFPLIASASGRDATGNSISVNERQFVLHMLYVIFYIIIIKPARVIKP
jgi:hypothetical protein